METIHHVEGYIGCESWAELWRPKVARPGNLLSNFCVFGKKRPCRWKFQNSALNVSPRHLIDVVVFKFRTMLLNRREMGELCVVYLTKKILAASQTVVTARIAPKMCRDQPQHCPYKAPNPFIFGGVIAQRVNTVFCFVEYFHYSPEAKRRFGRIITV